MPLWTGLLWNYEERYSNNIEKDYFASYHPIRHSNALIESYFRTFKESVCKGKRRNRPSDIIIELHRCVKAQSKTDKFEITQSSKGRKRRKIKINDEEKWRRRKVNKKNRNVYFHLTDKVTAKRAKRKTDGTYSAATKQYRYDVSTSDENILFWYSVDRTIQQLRFHLQNQTHLLFSLMMLYH